MLRGSHTVAQAPPENGDTSIQGSLVPLLMFVVCRGTITAGGHVGSRSYARWVANNGNHRRRRWCRRNICCVDPRGSAWTSSRPGHASDGHTLYGAHRSINGNAVRAGRPQGIFWGVGRNHCVANNRPMRWRSSPASASPTFLDVCIDWFGATDTMRLRKISGLGFCSAASRDANHSVSRGPSIDVVNTRIKTTLSIRSSRSRSPFAPNVSCATSVAARVAATCGSVSDQIVSRSFRFSDRDPRPSRRSPYRRAKRRRCLRPARNFLQSRKQK